MFLTSPLIEPGDFAHNPVNERYRDFSTSLTTSAVSRDLGFCFCKSGHTFPVSADALVPFERVTILLLR